MGKYLFLNLVLLFSIISISFYSTSGQIATRNATNDLPADSSGNSSRFNDSGILYKHDYYQTDNSSILNCQYDEQCGMYGDCCEDVQNSHQIQFDCTKISKLLNIYMVASCPDHSNSYFKQRCESKIGNFFLSDGLKEAIFVTDLTTNITYRNIYCAKCNQVDESNLKYWISRINCYYKHPTNFTFPNNTKNSQNSKWYVEKSEYGGENCFITTAIPKDVETRIRHCTKNDSTNTREDGNNKNINNIMYTSHLYSLIDDSFYRNEHYVYCNFRPERTIEKCDVYASTEEYYESLLNSKNSSSNTSSVARDGNCYCDEMCSRYDDCCSDYKSVIKYPQIDVKCVKIHSKLSYHAFMIGSCPQTWKNTDTEQMCSSYKNRNTLDPITDLNTNITYANIFCSKCNEVHNITSNLIRWNTNLICEVSMQEFLCSEKGNNYYSEKPYYEFDDCEIHYTAPPHEYHSHVRWCNPSKRNGNCTSRINYDEYVYNNFSKNNTIFDLQRPKIHKRTKPLRWCPMIEKNDKRSLSIKTDLHYSVYIDLKKSIPYIFILSNISNLLLLLHLFLFLTVEYLRNFPGLCIASYSFAVLIKNIILAVSNRNMLPQTHILFVIENRIDVNNWTVIKYFYNIDLEVILHNYNWLVCALWLLVMSYDVYRGTRNATKLQKKPSEQSNRKRFIIYSIFCWIFPSTLFMYVILCITIPDNSIIRDVLGPIIMNRHDSVINNSYYWLECYFDCICIFGVSFLSASFYIATTYLIYRNHKNVPTSSRMKLSQLWKLYGRLAVLMGMHWPFIILVKYTNSHIVTVNFAYVMELSQGIFIFLAFSCKVKVFKSFWNKSCSHRVASVRRSLDYVSSKIYSSSLL